MENCLFCKIAEGKIPADVVYEDEKVMAFRDIDPKAPVHILIIPKRHMTTVLEIGDDEFDIAAAMMGAAKKIAEGEGVGKRGFRLVINTLEDGGQTVAHLHMHLLGGRQLEWPPG